MNILEYTYIFTMTDWCEKIYQLGKGISNPSRYRIIELLMQGSKSVNDIVAHLKVTQPAVSQHLRTLRACGLVESKKVGQEVYYSLNTHYMMTILTHLSIGVRQCKREQHRTRV